MAIETREKSRYEIFKEAAESDIDAYRERLRADGSFCFVAQVKDLERLQYNLNQSKLVYLFGEHLGSHLADKFAIHCNMNLLRFFGQLTSEYRFFILHELKNNSALFAH